MCDSLVDSVYRPTRWLPGATLKTLYAYYRKPAANFCYRRERWDTPDGDFIDLDWLDGSQVNSPLVVLFHGLEGCSGSHYALGLMNQVKRVGWQGVVPHFRGCSGELNRLARSYHSGDSAEIDWILRRIKSNHPHRSICVVGVSLGGNALLKWLGEQEQSAQAVVDGVVSVSAPVDLEAAGNALDRGWRRVVFTRPFLLSLKPKALEKIATFSLPIDPAAMRRAATFRQFDDLYTAPVHGFKNADDYWFRASSKPWLKKIRVRTLLINALDDPFLPSQALPRSDEVSDMVSLEFPEYGGHVGFVGAGFPGDLDWLPRRVLSYFY